MLNAIYYVLEGYYLDNGINVWKCLE